MGVLLHAGDPLHFDACIGQECYYRGLNNYLYYFGGPYYHCSIMGSKALLGFQRPVLGFDDFGLLGIII